MLRKEPYRSLYLVNLHALDLPQRNFLLGILRIFNYFSEPQGVNPVKSSGNSKGKGKDKKNFQIFPRFLIKFVNQLLKNIRLIDRFLSKSLIQHILCIAFVNSGVLAHT